MITTVEQIQQLIQELGPSMPEIDAVVQTEEPSWAIQFSDETIVILEAADEPPRIVMSAELGAASGARQKAVYETLLCYNLMWRDSGGVKVGLAGPQGSLIISTELCIEGMLLMDFQDALNRFLKITRSWTQYVGQEEGAEAVGMPPLSGMGSMHLPA